MTIGEGITAGCGILGTAVVIIKIISAQRGNDDKFVCKETFGLVLEGINSRLERIENKLDRINGRSV
jgi:hypothetical protein